MPKQQRSKTPARPPTRAARPARARKQVASANNGVYLVVPGRRSPIHLDLGSDPEEVERLAVKWSYSLRNRERWVGRPELLERHRNEITQVATSAGLHGKVLAEVAAADLVEVSIPFHSEKSDWALRVMPWEYLIATATRHLRRGAMTVVRHLRTQSPRGRLHPPTAWLHIESAIGGLREGYDFSPERDLVEQAARSAGVSVKERLCDPDRPALDAALKKVKTHEVVHVSGFDSHQGLQWLDDASAERVPDGLLVRARPAEVAEAWSIARHLTNGGRRPRLVAFNIYYSAAHSAPSCVALGAEAAIGFQDAFDDTLAELFFATFYQAWRLAKWNTVAAFRHAWKTVRDQQQALHGTGIVLWSARSIRETLPGYWNQGVTLETKEIDQLWDKAVQKNPLVLTPENIADYLELDVQPLAALT